MLPGTNHARAIARSGVDWICVDTEHGNINDSQMHEAVTAIAHAGVSPLVRIAANEPWMVKRELHPAPTSTSRIYMSTSLSISTRQLTHPQAPSTAVPTAS
jgi:hypothetical protein